MFHILISLAAGAALPGMAAATPVDAAPFSATTLGDRDLGLATAREDIGQIATAEQTAVVSDSKVSGNVQTGAVSISDNAFQNLSGLAVINANSGNNVAINAAMNVNVTLLRD